MLICISFSEDHFVLANSADQDENAALCGISSESSLYAKVPILGFPVYKGFYVAHHPADEN